MDTFRKVVISIAVIILVLCLIVIGYIVSQDKYHSNYPPNVEDCPDYWTEKTSGDTSKCYNVKSLGTMTSECAGPMNFTDTTLCNKYKWAKHCNITWDGVTNSRDPCDTDSDSDNDS
tara:strand:+ start:68 stop:418 length:351 start_codon:yes stop_codon:yes gene_type:complete